MPVAAQHWQQTHRDQEKHWTGDIPWWEFPAHLLPWTTAMGVVHGTYPSQSRALTRVPPLSFTAGRVSYCLFTSSVSSLKIPKIPTGWSLLEKLAPRRWALPCLGLPGSNAEQSFPRTIPSTVWGTSISEVHKTALQNMAQQNFQGYTLGFWHLISIYLVFHDLSLFCLFSFTISRRAQRKLLKWQYLHVARPSDKS